MNRNYFLTLADQISFDIIRIFRVFANALLIFSTVKYVLKDLHLVGLRYLQFALKTQSLLHFLDVIKTLHSVLSELYYRLLNELIQQRQRFLNVSLLLVSTVMEFGRSRLLGVICKGKVILFTSNVLVPLQFKLLFLQLSYRFIIIVILISIFEGTRNIVLI